ncbi:MAG: hypothetical protein GF341_11775 [candidate division Zixibacteria bacterium]|nr:hypothetical protein [candidate division Zixibacteria bacterium]
MSDWQQTPEVIDGPNATIYSSFMRRVFYNEPGHTHFLTFSCYHKHQFLTENSVRRWLADSVDKARRRYALSIWAYVFMPEHVHLLISPYDDEYSISRILHAIKQPVAARMVKQWRRESPWKLSKIQTHQGRRPVHRLWQAGGGFDRNMTDWEAISNATSYIEWNPVRRRLVKEPLDWAWSSARAREGYEDVPLSIDRIPDFSSDQAT